MTLEDSNSVEGGADAQVTRLIEASFETLTDDMIGRLAKTASDSLTLLDELNRSHITEALPAISELVASGDLARLAALARFLGAAEDALTDDMIGRLSAMASGGLTILDRANSVDVDRLWHLVARLGAVLTPALVDRLTKCLPSLLDLFLQAQESGLLRDAMGAALRTREQITTLSRPAGGFGGLWALMKDADNQRVIQSLLLFGRHFLGEKG
ncbi:MAG TPA: hypothetical protein VMV40_07930 [Acidiferrobacter sp.]|nr:hypothetical protein [Acidiferrobacter sp.]